MEWDGEFSFPSFLGKFKSFGRTQGNWETITIIQSFFGNWTFGMKAYHHEEWFLKLSLETVFLYSNPHTKSPVNFYSEPA